MAETEFNIIRFPSLRKKLDGVSRATVSRWEKSNNFPPRIHLGRNSIGWRLDQVEQWLKERAITSEEL